MFKLRNLEFLINSAFIKGKFSDGVLECFIEVDMKPIDKDDESWSPSLCHQGLRFNVSSWAELPGTIVEYSSSSEESYTHPEIGMLYVFGHEETRNNYIEFGPLSDDGISIKWTGVNNVWWDDEFDEDVPFDLDCKLEVLSA